MKHPNPKNHEPSPQPAHQATPLSQTALDFALLNPIKTAQAIPRVDLDSILIPTCRSAHEDLSRRELLLLFRRENAAAFLGHISPGFHRFGFSKGQFSLIDIIKAITAKIGPARFALSTWTTAKTDLTELEAMLSASILLNPRFLLDLSFQRRQPALIKRIRQIFGEESIRVTRNHAKFMLFERDRWRIVCRTSMNLNFNPRLEDIEIKDDPPLYAFLDAILEAISAAHDAKAQAKHTYAKLAGQFKELSGPNLAPDP